MFEPRCFYCKERITKEEIDDGNAVQNAFGTPPAYHIKCQWQKGRHLSGGE